MCAILLSTEAGTSLYKQVSVHSRWHRPCHEVDASPRRDHAPSRTVQELPLVTYIHILSQSHTCTYPLNTRQLLP